MRGGPVLGEASGTRPMWSVIGPSLRAGEEADAVTVQGSEKPQPWTVRVFRGARAGRSAVRCVSSSACLPFGLRPGGQPQTGFAGHAAVSVRLAAPTGQVRSSESFAPFATQASVAPRGRVPSQGAGLLRRRTGGRIVFRVRSRAAIVLCVLGATSCSSSGGAAAILDAGAISFVADVYPAIAANCLEAGCHDMSRTMNHFEDFSTAKSVYERWVNGPGFDFCVDVPADGILTMRTIVVPGDPDGSFLITKIAPPTDAPCQDPTHHRQMPPAPRPRLSGAAVERIATWIREGALQN